MNKIGKPFPKGVSGNPGGRAPLSQEEKKLLSLTKQEVARLLNMVCEMTLEEMKHKFDDKHTRGIEKLFIKTILDGVKGDSVKAAEFILNRTVGKVSDQLILRTPKVLEITRPDGTGTRITGGDEGE